MPVTMGNRGSWTARFAAVIAATLLLTGCASQPSAGSRATLYENIDDLAADSSVIVIGTVSDQRSEGDATIVSVDVENTPTNPRLGENLDDIGRTVAVGDVVEVRQSSGPALETDEQYLLYLAPSMLDGDAVTQYYITGAVAGLYVRNGDEFRRVVTDSGDTLPDTIAVAGPEGG